jgi:hypothetical protein
MDINEEDVAMLQAAMTRRDIAYSVSSRNAEAMRPSLR